MKKWLIPIWLIWSYASQAQQVTGIGAGIGDFPVNKILNYSSSSSTFRQFNTKLLIVDFFGTWCVPCVKALPHLTTLQATYKDKITILLVSEEAQTKLERFIKKQDAFSLPVAVDEEKKIISLFQPPSYPYTVVIGRNNKILAIPSQEELTVENMEKWLKEQDAGGSKITNEASSALSPATNSMTPSANKLVQLSQDFMYAAKTGDETVDFVKQLQQLSMDDLELQLKSDDEKKAFWINLYNAYTQVSLKKDPDQYKSRGRFFGSKQIDIAGKKFSLDDIEHGLLRRSKIKWSLGYLNKLFPGKTEKALRVEKLDYRLHFALNCGAKSCPPIAFYRPENINQQLDLAMNAYLKSEVEYDEKNNTVKLPAIMNWFRRDFGGKRKMIRLLEQLSIIPAGKSPKIKFKKYDWTIYLQNYKS
jgi:thiol-disulfide isomerase/thioredoxin